MKRFSDILLSSKIVFLFGACIGVIGNANIIFFYFFRIKERGERYFIPLLGIVDLLGCLFLASFNIMDNEYVFNFKNVAACKISAFYKYVFRQYQHICSLLYQFKDIVLFVNHYVQNWHFVGNVFHLESCVLYLSLIRPPYWPQQTSLRRRFCTIITMLLKKSANFLSNFRFQWGIISFSCFW